MGDGNDGNQDDHNDEFDVIFHTTKLGLDITEGGRNGDEVVVTKVSNGIKNIIHPQDTIISIGNIRLSASNYITNDTTTTLLTKVSSIISSFKRPLTIRFSRNRRRKRNDNTGSADNDDAKTVAATTMMMMAMSNEV